MSNQLKRLTSLVCRRKIGNICFPVSLLPLNLEKVESETVGDLSESLLEVGPGNPKI